MKRYQYKPHTVEAYQWLGEGTLPEDIASSWAIGQSTPVVGAQPGQSLYLKSNMKVEAAPGFYVVRDEIGEWRAMGSGYFEYHFYNVEDRPPPDLGVFGQSPRYKFPIGAVLLGFGFWGLILAIALYLTR